MDLAYWGFRRWPFERSFAADRFFAGPQHEEALARLLFLVEECRRSGIVIGQAGTGKTFLLKLLQQRAERLGRLVVRCEATGLDGPEFASEIAAGFHIPCEPDATSARIWSGLRTKFEALALIQQPIVVIIDHFDHVEYGCQKSVCRLYQLADLIDVKLTVVIATRESMIPAAIQDFVELRVELTPWTETECSQFITSAIAQAGSTEVRFTDGALFSVFAFSNGVPSSIVALCNVTLLAAMGQDEKLISREIVEAAARELSPHTGGELAKQGYFQDRTLEPASTGDISAVWKTDQEIAS